MARAPGGIGRNDPPTGAIGGAKGAPIEVTGAAIGGAGGASLSSEDGPRPACKLEPLGRTCLTHHSTQQQGEGTKARTNGET